MRRPGLVHLVLSAVAGLLPKVDTIVSNTMALHPVVSPLAQVKGLASTADASAGPASEGMATDEEIGRREQAAKLGTRP